MGGPTEEWREQRVLGRDVYPKQTQAQCAEGNKMYDEIWVIYRISQPITSKINQGQYWRVGAYRISDDTYYEATVDNTCINFPTWEPIVNNQGPLGVYKGLFATDRETKYGVPVFSADSDPILEYECNEVPDLIKSLRREHSNQFASLFGDGD